MLVFQKGKMGSVETKNRFVHSPTYEALASSDGSCTQELIDFNREIAEGGIGTNEISFAFVHESGRHLKGQVGVHDDAMIPGLKKLTEVHGATGVRSLIQIAHAGPHANETYSHAQSLAPTGMSNVKGGLSRTMTTGEIKKAVGWFVDAAKRVKSAGFDGVQIHAAHGYLVSAFLSPYYNRREDEYGGSFGNRLRFFLEILHGIREEVGRDYPIMTKMNSEDQVEGGLTREMMADVALALEENGIDAIELSVGSNTDKAVPTVSSPGVDPKTPEEEGYFKEAARIYKRKVKNTPLILVGGFRSLEGSELVLKEGIADFISLSRPLVREPGLVKRWQDGDTKRARCVSCNLCRKFLFSQKVPYLMCIPEMKLQGKL
ncbi:MAG: NADH:flavin oxidoreductase [Synergistaceae bacterium]|jgi:2,4-dienoyl-CoA reductase-like NADH-dependent reductase (Old Yellow Enzyme family)|nr:NADH:flavin oxidoreductase [Synergistaceae bacterium]